MYIENPSEWGAKRTCQGCSAKYYDMRRTPVVCPKCQTEYVEPPKRKSAPASVRGISWHQRSRAAAADASSAARVHGAGSHSPFADKPVSADSDAETEEGDGPAEKPAAEDEEEKNEKQ